MRNPGLRIGGSGPTARDAGTRRSHDPVLFQRRDRVPKGRQEGLSALLIAGDPANTQGVRAGSRSSSSSGGERPPDPCAPRVHATVPPHALDARSALTASAISPLRAPSERLI